MLIRLLYITLLWVFVDRSVELDELPFSDDGIINMESRHSIFISGRVFSIFEKDIVSVLFSHGIYYFSACYWNLRKQLKLYGRRLKRIHRFREIGSNRFSELYYLQRRVHPQLTINSSKPIRKVMIIASVVCIIAHLLLYFVLKDAEFCKKILLYLLTIVFAAMIVAGMFLLLPRSNIIWSTLFDFNTQQATNVTQTRWQYKHYKCHWKNG